MAKHNDLGKWGEDLAVDFLKQEGYVMLERDWRHGRSLIDLDIVCKTPDLRTVVFVEVKTRTADDLTAPEDAVDTKKIRRIGRSANEYVKMHDIVEDLRFDIIGIVGAEGGSHTEINHIKDAFNPLLV